jgi:8-oxo-dGTP pyrophosphatase MutT (NUDIX family)
MVRCQSFFGNWLDVPIEKLSFRSSVYAVMVLEGKVLLLTNHNNGLFTFPGGGVDLGETLENALRRELIEETGLEVEIGGLLHVAEQFFYYDPLDKAFQAYMFYYSCRPTTTQIAPHQVEFDESEFPRWVDLAALNREQFQYGNREIFDLIQKER